MVVKKGYILSRIAFKFSKSVHKNDLKIAYGWVHLVLSLRDTHKGLIFIQTKAFWYISFIVWIALAGRVFLCG